MKNGALILGAILVPVVSAGLAVAAALLVSPRADTGNRGTAEDSANLAAFDAQAIMTLREETRELEQRVDELSARVDELESAPRVPDVNRATQGGEELLKSALREPSAELVELIAGATRLGASLKSADGGAGRKTVLGGKDVEEVIEYFEGEIDGWAESHALGPGQVEALKALTRRAVTARSAAEADGAGKEELNRLDVEAQVEVRRIVGDQVYYDTERRRLEREARGALMWVSVAVGGLTQEQHAAVDAVVAASVSDKVEDVMRLRSVPMSAASREATAARLEEVDTRSWERIRDGILTTEQRARIPDK